MAKVVVYTLLTTTFIVFLFLTPTKQHGHNHPGLSHRRLGHQFPKPNNAPKVVGFEELEAWNAYK
ncbi:hypothetical protein Dsin_001517 [Dipteronia sinensis]|uniref:Transmembrane protein n=1 Tax=Dipteronia sinensis TaxID=43782 RepID=A0AAE0B4I7_9ROSI|nr:hypothetical protein Dsin_001517 [Dipteronia sinensis]